MNKFDSMERQTLECHIEQSEAVTDHNEKRKILERKLVELSETRRAIEKRTEDEEQREALKRLDSFEAFIKCEIDELVIYDNPPSRFPEQPKYFENKRMQKTLEQGSDKEKNEIIYRMRWKEIEGKALKARIEENLKDPIYRQEVILSYKSRVRRFNALTLGLLAGIATGTFLAHSTLYNVLGADGITLIFWMLAIFAGGLFVYAGKRLYRCPACEFQLNFLSKYSAYNDPLSLDRTNQSCCPKCGAPFSFND